MPPHHLSLRRLHRTYKALLAACLLLLLSFTLPPPWYGISSVGYLLLGLVMVRGLGDPVDQLQFGAVPRRLFKLLGWATVMTGLIWFLTPLQLRQSGVPVLILWALFSHWSAIRLIRGLAQEQHVGLDVLRGSMAGYLMLGLAGGLICAALETVNPGSFSNIDLAGTIPASEAEVYPVWSLNFVRLNYFAFVSLTTAGYGDITPLTPMAQMLSVGLAVVGTFYIAAVMGLLISRLSTSQRHRRGQQPRRGQPGHRRGRGPDQGPDQDADGRRPARRLRSRCPGMPEGDGGATPNP
ncbi:potassium channel family protein [Cyanobium sp. NIES-981]|uniref:potassium channel family protein n=1 Tax=Cyanobium sp. NIES-981 TaxID=1851505 RepID=UPI0007DDFED6|nr:potassium channel family protein [Cyanobium sp. NIES-981]SBO42760.1 Potassium channel [Cyanobium sp. NIES-981]